MKKTKENSKDKGSYSTSDYKEVKCDKLVSFILILCSVNNSIVQFDGFSFQERDKRKYQEFPFGFNLTMK